MNVNSLFNQTSVPVLEQTVHFAQKRHAVLAGNVANMDTPGYRVRDLSPEKFQTRLREALATRDRRQTYGPLNDRQYFQGDPLREAGRDVEGMLFHDDSNDSLEQQVAAIAKNQSLHNLAMSVLVSQFRLLKVAISEQVS